MELTEYTLFFGAPIEQSEALKISQKITELFRKPFAKRDMATHGPLWSQYAASQGTMDINNINIAQSTEGYIFIEAAKKNRHLFLSSFSQYLLFLNNRDDGLYPAIYFISKDFSICIGESGERGSMRPIYVQVASRCEF